MLPNGLIPSAARTVKIGGSCSCNQLSPFLSVPSSSPTSWPSKASSDVLDYSLDLSAWLGQDELALTPSIAVTRSSGAVSSTPEDLYILWSRFYTPSICTLMIGCGLLGASYNVRLTLSTVQGRVGVFTMPLTITAELPQITSDMIVTPQDGSISDNNSPITDGKGQITP